MSTKPATAHKERRGGPRLAIKVEVGLHTETQFFSGMSEDIAAGGLFVATYKELPLGAHVELTLTLPSDVSVTTTGRIVWLREARDDMVPGVGVAFENLEPQAREAIEHFISARPPLFYDL